VNQPCLQDDFDENLKLAASQLVASPPPSPLAVSPWVAMSALQKAIRRGREALALRAAATLLRDAPQRLWRRLGCAGPEDVGFGDLAAVATATAALAGVRKRAEWGGEWAVARAVVCALARAQMPRRRRSLDDLPNPSRLRAAAQRIARHGP
jgi:hypothetical protein